MKRHALLLASVLLSTTAFALDPTISATVNTPTRPVVVGTTNLPDGTELMISIRRKESSYHAQDKVKVTGGRFQTVQFSQKGSDLNPGTYALQVMMPMAQVQSRGVKAVIGEKGERLKGRLVKTTSLGTLVEYNSTFRVGGGADKVQDAKAKDQSKKDTQAWTVKSCNDNIDLANSLVRAGKVSGREYIGEERKRKVDECIRYVNSGQKK